MKEKLLNPKYILSCFINFTSMLVHYACLINIPIFMIDVLHGTPTLAGLTTTVYMFSSMIIRPVGAPILNKFGKRGTMIIGGSVVLIAACGYTFLASVMVLLFAIRILNGFGMAFLQTAVNTSVIDFIPYSRKGEGLGNFSMFMNVASAAAPITSLAVVAKFGYTTLFEACIGFSIVSIIAAYFLKSENTVIEEKIVVNKQKKVFSVTDYIEPKAILPGILGAFMFVFAYSVITAFFTKYAKSIPEVAPYVGYFFIVVTSVLVLARPAIGRIIDSKGEGYVMYPGFICLSIGMFIISRMNSPLTMFLAAVFLGLGYSAVYAGAQISCLKSTTKERTGVANITFFMCFDLGFSLGSYVFGLVATSFGYNNMYLLVSLVYIIGFVLYFIFIGMKSKSILPQSDNNGSKVLNRG